MPELTPSKTICRFVNRKKTQETIKKTCEEKELTTKDLSNWLGKIPNFLGVFPCDKIPSFNFTKPKFIIINIDSSSQPGSHWIAVRVDKATVEIFDSLGFNPSLWGKTSERLSLFIKGLISSRKLFLSPVLQTRFDFQCGLYSAFFVISRQTHSFRYCCECFDRRLSNNKFILHNLLLSCYKRLCLFNLRWKLTMRDRKMYLIRERRLAELTDKALKKRFK